MSDDGDADAVHHEEPEVPEIDCRGWMKAMGGRRLKGPRTNKSSLSLPQWMMQSHEVLQKSCPRSKLEQPSSRTSSKAHSAKGSSKTTALPALVPILPDNSSDTVSFSSEREVTCLPKRKTISSDLDRRKKKHPRLRWPRLTKDANENAASEGDGNLGMIQEAIEEIEENPEDEEADQLIALAVKEYLTEDDLAPDSIGPGSLFYTGRPVPIAPQWTQHEKMPGHRRRAPTEESLMSALPMLPKGRGGEARGAKDRGDRQTMLETADAHYAQNIMSGGAATVHLPRLDGNMINHLAEAKNGGSSSLDRKYHIRQAPVSHIMARKPIVSEGTSSSSTSKAGLRREDPDGKQPSIEYLNFESWGIDDAYVELLCKRSELHKIHCMNFSGNRITDESLKFLLQESEAPWALQSLQFANNKLQERGGRAIARLLDGVRPPLRELDLSENLIGDKACEELCEVLSASLCVYLQGLTLARNELGHNDSVGKALGQVVGSARNLEVLDLHWNFLHGAGALAFFRWCVRKQLFHGWQASAAECGMESARLALR